MTEVENLSPWWRRSVIVTIVFCVCVLGWLAKLAYSGAPPISERVVGTDGAILFTNADISCLGDSPKTALIVAGGTRCCDRNGRLFDSNSRPESA